VKPSTTSRRIRRATTASRPVFFPATGLLTSIAGQQLLTIGGELLYRIR